MVEIAVNLRNSLPSLIDPLTTGLIGVNLKRMSMLAKVIRHDLGIFRLEFGGTFFIHRGTQCHIQLIPSLGEDKAAEIGQCFVDKHERSRIHTLGQCDVDRLAITKGTAKIELEITVFGEKTTPYDAADSVASQQYVVGNRDIVGGCIGVCTTISITITITTILLPSHNALVVAIDEQRPGVIMRHKVLIISMLLVQIPRERGADIVAIDRKCRILWQYVIGIELKLEIFGEPEHSLGNVDSEAVDVILVQVGDFANSRKAMRGQTNHPRPGSVESIGVELTVVGTGIDQCDVVFRRAWVGSGVGVASQEQNGSEKAGRTGAADDDVVGS